MAQIIRITSEALQATIRRLLPSQQGFGEDLQATNVVTPIIDLTPTAEGSVLPLELNNALSFGSNSSYLIEATATTLSNTPGFWRCLGTISNFSGSSDNAQIEISDGLATKVLFDYEITATVANYSFGAVTFDFITYLRSGDTLTGRSSSTNCPLTVTVRQVADVNGNLVVPAGFTSE